VSCPPESTVAVYTDGALAPSEKRTLEAHLVHCQQCRALVVALRDEAALLSDVLHERAAPVRAAAPPTPARGLALGLAPSLLLVAVAATVIGWLLETGLPESMGWMNPFRIRGLVTMAFNLIFLLRDEVPGLLELALAVAATAGVSAILTFAVTVLFRRWVGPGALGLLCLAAVATPPPSAAHFGFHEHATTEVAAGDVHDGTLVASSRTVNVDGVVEGDLIVLAERLAVRGEVRGNVFAIAQNLEMSGRVTGSVHVASERSHVAGDVQGDLYALSEHLTLAKPAAIGRDASLAVTGAAVEGTVGRNVWAWIDWIEVRGSIGGHLDARGDRVALLDGARIGGDVDAELPKGREIETSPGAAVAGELRSAVHRHPGRAHLARFLKLRFWTFLGIQLTGAFVVGLALHTLFPALFRGRLDTTGAFFRSLGIGFLALIATPFAIALCAVTLVGIPLSLIGLAVYLAALYVAFLVVAALVGSTLVRSRGEATGGFSLALLAGLLVLLVGASLPFLGHLLVLLVVLAGLGLLVDRAQFAWRAARGAPG
jgi:cytoskeletal protein CcmA (bactofilin family)